METDHARDLFDFHVRLKKLLVDSLPAGFVSADELRSTVLRDATPYRFFSRYLAPAIAPLERGEPFPLRGFFRGEYDAINTNASRDCRWGITRRVQILLEYAAYCYRAAFPHKDSRFAFLEEFSSVSNPGDDSSSLFYACLAWNDDWVDMTYDTTESIVRADSRSFSVIVDSVQNGSPDAFAGAKRALRVARIYRDPNTRTIEVSGWATDDDASDASSGVSLQDAWRIRRAFETVKYERVPIDDVESADGLAAAIIGNQTAYSRSTFDAGFDSSSSNLSGGGYEVLRIPIYDGGDDDRNLPAFLALRGSKKRNDLRADYEAALRFVTLYSREPCAYFDSRIHVTSTADRGGNFYDGTLLASTRWRVTPCSKGGQRIEAASFLARLNELTAPAPIIYYAESESNDKSSTAIDDVRVDSLDAERNSRRFSLFTAEFLSFASITAAVDPITGHSRKRQRRF